MTQRGRISIKTKSMRRRRRNEAGPPINSAQGRISCRRLGTRQLSRDIFIIAEERKRRWALLESEKIIRKAIAGVGGSSTTRKNGNEDDSRPCRPCTFCPWSDVGGGWGGVEEARLVSHA
jgi:hypothetical protein